jgi:hypothetical protein
MLRCAGERQVLLQGVDLFLPPVPFAPAALGLVTGGVVLRLKLGQHGPGVFHELAVAQNHVNVQGIQDAGVVEPASR